MRTAAFQFDAPGTPGVHVHCWQPQGLASGVLLIVHGMAEHGARYARLAAAATAQGWAVYALDLPGHGLTPGVRGHFADHDGWSVALAAIHALRERIAVEQPGLPIVLLGHSMGSFLAQHYLVEYGAGLSGAILSATNFTLGPLRSIGWLLMRAEAALLGAQHPSALAEALSFKTFNKAFEPARTPFDWLSRDAAEVDAYIADPLCGFRCTATLWSDLFAAGEPLMNAARLSRIPKALPILLICGSRDPVSAGANGPRQLAGGYRAAGVVDVEVKVYEGGRHELLNDICREETTTDLLVWCAARKTD
jgi:alpha-beta hydrolase superfamily lysophospholipase